MRGKPAGAFAAGERAGKMVAWESIGGQSLLVAVGTAFPTVATTVGGIDTRFVTLIPANVLRGAITLERVRGSLVVYFSAAEMAAELESWTCDMSLQLVPLRDAAIVEDAILSSRNAADLESNRFIWRRTYHPVSGAAVVRTAGVAMHEANMNRIEVDVKSKRRFDRARWALILVCDIAVNSVPDTFVSFNLRGLFKSSDGL